MNRTDCRTSATLFLVATLLGTTAGTSAAGAQQSIGSVATADATVTGNAAATNGRVLLAGNSTVTAKDHVAEVALARGGVVRVCSTSGLHITAGTPNNVPNGNPNSQQVPLMLALDRGAMEIRMVSGTSDVVMTPDLRLSVKQPGALDLRIRVTPNGDTCVENRVAQTEAKTIAQAKEEAQILDQGPTLTVVNLFGDESYEVRPGQRVLFEHANLREVVDHESSPCGCPGEIPTVVSDAGTLSLLPGDKMSPEQAAALHPFPAAVSQGLAPAPSAPFPPPPPPGTAQVQVATSLTYAGDGSGSNAAPAAAASTPTGGPVVQAPKQQDGFFHRLGRFFKRIL